MACPFCGDTESKVIDSRDSGNGIRRRRECVRCSLRFTTYELVQNRELLVVKHDKRRESFNRDKLWASLTKACAKRPLPTGTLEKIVQDIEMQLSDFSKAEVTSKSIGKMVMEKLKTIDRVAYIRFASVYRDFRDIETFREEINALLSPKTKPSIPDNQSSFLQEEDDALSSTRRKRGRPPSHLQSQKQL